MQQPTRPLFVELLHQSERVVWEPVLDSFLGYVRLIPARIWNKESDNGTSIKQAPPGTLPGFPFCLLLIYRLFHICNLGKHTELARSNWLTVPGSDLI